MKVLAGPTMDSLVSRYLIEKIDFRPTGPFVAFAIYTNDGKFVAGLIVSNFRGSDCEISMAAETATWAKKGIMRYIFSYIFNKMNCIRCTCIVQKVDSSKRTRRFLEGMGFVLEGNLRLAYDGETDALVYGLLRRDCRFLRENQGGLVGEENRTRAAAAA
jgi:RimJ/RimL family protein N-acetyltransferase